MQKRVNSLDWLRGLMALSIMLYHLGGRNDAASLLGKLGIYGVSVFFILSGLSMAIAYDRHISDVRSAAVFFVRRLFRIWPLLWLAVVLVAVPAYISGQSYDLITIALNLSTAFGFVAPTQYINLGAWSIGNEMVYYALTPLLIPVYRYHKRAGNALTLIALAIGILFAFRLLDPSVPLAKQWAVYVNPFNNLFLYCAGIALYFNCRDWQAPFLWSTPLFIATGAAFVFYPSAGDQITIATGIDRVVMSLISVSIALAFYKCAPSLPDVIGRQFERLGVATYGVYLLHPIVAVWARKSLFALGVANPYVLVLTVIVATIGLSLFTFRRFEEPFIELGKRLTTSSRLKHAAAQ